jgi:hypothetical protein
MFKTLTDWINWTNTTVDDERNTWIEWQKNQPSSHYEKSDVFQYYLSYHPRFQPPRDSCITDDNSRFYTYCFGDFACLLVKPHGGSNVTEYFQILLDVYDSCKGPSRRIAGDPIGISLVREVVQRRSLIPIQDHDFRQYNYEYDVIHAHTVAQFSLSTLLMRFVSHYMSYVTTRGRFFAISISACQKSMTNSIFGEPKVLSVASSPIEIPGRSDSDQRSQALSWPRDNATCIRCKTCNRVTENVWGKFQTCLDCHLKRICSECGLPAIIIGTDSLPKCHYHQPKK